MLWKWILAFSTVLGACSDAITTWTFAKIYHVKYKSLEITLQKSNFYVIAIATFLGLLCIGYQRCCGDEMHRHYIQHIMVFRILYLITIGRHWDEETKTDRLSVALNSFYNGFAGGANAYLAFFIYKANSTANGQLVSANVYIASAAISWISVVAIVVSVRK
ncbi:MAG: hypothetical protein J3R72DRAFT_464274 [Linnemannia gamsii]|nr:MAG: hypothetical protein J3R72DRAFT_464274 [Linnemannia gamsii]